MVNRTPSVRKIEGVFAVKKLKRRRIYEKQYLFTSARHEEKILDISFKKFQKYCHFRLTTSFLFAIIYPRDWYLSHFYF